MHRPDTARRARWIAHLWIVLVAATPALVQAGPWARPEAESPDGPEHTRVYLSEEEALREVFGTETDSIATDEWRPDEAERAALERRLGWRVTEPAFRIHTGRAGDRITGWAVVTEEVGLYRPITFIVKLAPDRTVDAVRVMVYRESRGAEVRRVRFLKQYRGKDLTSPVRINRDIVAVTGATLSTRAINAGVRRVLHVVDAWLAAGGDEAGTASKVKAERRATEGGGAL